MVSLLGPTLTPTQRLTISLEISHPSQLSPGSNAIGTSFVPLAAPDLKVVRTYRLTAD